MIAAFARWLILVIAVWAASCIPWLGIRYEGWTSIVMAALFLGLVNTFVRPLLVLVSLPFVLLTLGLFVWIINAGLLYGVSWLMGEAFIVPSFWSAMGASLVISLVSMMLGANVKVETSARRVERRVVRPRRDDEVIDI
jgi:putative membrane protein